MHLFLKLFSTFKNPAKKHTRGSFACFRKQNNGAISQQFTMKPING